MLGFFTSQGFGYSLTAEDRNILDRVEQHIDTIARNNPTDLVQIEQQLHQHLDRLSPRERAYVVLQHIAGQIHSRIAPTPQYAQHPSIIQAWASLFQ